MGFGKKFFYFNFKQRLDFLGGTSYGRAEGTNRSKDREGVKRCKWQMEMTDDD